MGVSFSTLPLDSMLLLTGHLPSHQIEKGEFKFLFGWCASAFIFFVC